MALPFDVFGNEKHTTSLQSEKISPTVLEAAASQPSSPSATPNMRKGVLEEANDRLPDHVDQQLARQTTKSSYNPGPPPDGGVAALTMCLCAHLVIMNTWGFVNSFGVFQAYYTSLLARSPSDISWIGSVQVTLTFFLSTFTGRLSDAGYFRYLIISGAALLVVGAFTTSVCTQYWQFLLAQGFCTGTGCGLIFCPTMAVVTTYFEKNRALALGFVSCGASIGGLIYPAMGRNLLPVLGFSWTYRVMGFVQLATILVPLALAKPRMPPRKSGALVDLASFKQLDYTFWVVGFFFNFSGLYILFYYLAPFGREGVYPAMSYSDSLNLLMIVNGVSVIGRLLPNKLADVIGPVNLMIPTGFLCSVSCFCWVAVTTPIGIYVWSGTCGIVLGTLQSTFPAGLASLNREPRKAGTKMGMAFTIVSFCVLTGPPVAGRLLSAMNGRYLGAQILAASLLITGTSFIMLAKRANMKNTSRGWLSKI